MEKIFTEDDINRGKSGMPYDWYVDGYVKFVINKQAQAGEPQTKTVLLQKELQEEPNTEDTYLISTIQGYDMLARYKKDMGGYFEEIEMPITIPRRTPIYDLVSFKTVIALQEDLHPEFMENVFNGKIKNNQPVRVPVVVCKRPTPDFRDEEVIAHHRREHGKYVLPTLLPLEETWDSIIGEYGKISSGLESGLLIDFLNKNFNISRKK